MALKKPVPNKDWNPDQYNDQCPDPKDLMEYLFSKDEAALLCDILDMDAVNEMVGNIMNLDENPSTKKDVALFHGLRASLHYHYHKKFGY